MQIKINIYKSWATKLYKSTYYKTQHDIKRSDFPIQLTQSPKIIDNPPQRRHKQRKTLQQLWRKISPKLAHKYKQQRGRNSYAEQNEISIYKKHYNIYYAKMTIADVYLFNGETKFVHRKNSAYNNHNASDNAHSGFFLRF